MPAPCELQAAQGARGAGRRASCRAVAAMFQKQLELGHLRLPSDGGEALIAAAGHCQAPEVAEPDFELIARLVGRPGETAGQEAEEEPATTRRERLQVRVAHPGPRHGWRSGCEAGWGARWEQLMPTRPAPRAPSALPQDISRSVWATSNPCFSERPAHFVSSAQADYAWRAEDVERMRTQVGCLKRQRWLLEQQARQPLRAVRPLPPPPQAALCLGFTAAPRARPAGRAVGQAPPQAGRLHAVCGVRAAQPAHAAAGRRRRRAQAAVGPRVHTGGRKRSREVGFGGGFEKRVQVRDYLLFALCP